MSDERDGPFDLKPSEVIEKMKSLGVHISREQAVVFSTWAYNEFCAWRLDQLALPPASSKAKPSQGEGNE